MIRMGRSNKTGDLDETPQYPQNNQSVSGNLYGINQESGVMATAGRAMSDSESMARDIKEGRLSGFVGNGTMLTGDTHFQAMLRVDGHLTGSVSSDSGTLIIGSSGQVDANVNVAAAMINGAVNGDIIATERLELGRSARVIGNIQTPKLVIEEGAILEGACNMLKSKETLEQRIADEQNRLQTAQLSSQAFASDDDDDDDDLELSAEDEDDEEEEERAEAAAS